MAGAFTSTITKVSVTLLSLDARPHHFAFKRSGTAASGADGFDEMYAAANGFWPHVASHMEVDRLDPFEKIECVGKLNSRTRQRNPNFVTPSDYSIGVFLAEETPKKPGHKQLQRDRRVFLRAAVYDKDLLLVNFSPNPTPRPSRTSYSDSGVFTTRRFGFGRCFRITGASRRFAQNGVESRVYPSRRRRRQVRFTTRRKCHRFLR